MPSGLGFASIASAALLAGQLASVIAAWPRAKRRTTFVRPQEPIDLTVIRPLSGLESHSDATLRSTFELASAARLLFCVAKSDDPIVPLVQRLIAEYPEIDAKLLIGNEQMSANPKLNNLIKGWQRTTSEWVAFVDSNVLLPRDTISRLIDSWDDRCGMVCSPPIGKGTENFGAELEAIFLNGYQARWQLAAAHAGIGFAQGKVMFFRRDLLTRSGGLKALAAEPAEDAAATKVVRAAGLKVRLIAEPLEQPLGGRRLMDVWMRQLRWAQLRRATFPALFYSEIATSSLVPLVLMLVDFRALPGAAMLIYLAIWYGAEMALAVRYGWGTPRRMLPLAIVRDVLIVPLWLTAIWRNKFEWQGHAMNVGDIGSPARIAGRAD